MSWFVTISYPSLIWQDILDFPLFSEDWAADEELLLVEGLESFGLGNWEQIAEHIGTKNKLECERHYIEVYLNGPTWPIPVRSLDLKRIEYLLIIKDMSKKLVSRRSTLGIVPTVSKPPPKAARVCFGVLKGCPTNYFF